MKKVHSELKHTANEMRKNITIAEHYLNSLPLKDEYKVLFLQVSRERGLLGLPKLEDAMIAISNGSCEVTRLFLVQKMIGIELLHFIVDNANEKKRVDVYEAIKKDGVKATREEVEKLIGLPVVPRLQLK